MSFAGGSGHKSPFAERAKVTKSHLSPRRSFAGSGNGRSAGVQQSLFGKESTLGGDSSAKVGQFRNAAQPDVIKEPTTPTRASEGSNMKGNRRDEFSSFNNRRVGTPVKTPRTAFGTIPPRSPKRPYMGSPKYQKVLQERPAFYNSPAAAEPLTESGKKEVSISELQKRLKRFLQDENVLSRSQLDVTPNNLDEVPYNISRSPRVNPLFHHDDTVLQVAKGGVAFTAGAEFIDDETCMHASVDSFNGKEDHNPGFHFAKSEVAFTAGEMDTTCMHAPVLAMEEDESAALQRTPSPEPEPLVPQSASEDEPDSNDVSNEASDSSEEVKSLSPEDFPVHLEGGNGSQVEEVSDEDALVAPEVVDVEEMPAQPEQQPIATSTSGIVEVQDCPIEEAIPLPNPCVDESLEEKAPQEAQVEVEKSTVVAAVEHQLEAKPDCSFEEEAEEEVEILESWSQRFLKFVVVAVMVACMMGFMVLASGSQGLLPKSLHGKHVASSFFTSSVIPISVGFMGLGREHEQMPCLPSVHFGLMSLSSTSTSDASQHESSPPNSSCEPSSVAWKDSKLIGIENVLDLDQLKTVTDRYKELQERLFSDVASLTSESALSDSSKAEMAMDGEQSAAVEDVSEIAAFDEAAEVLATNDVFGVPAVEEIILSEDVSESAAMEDILELVDEIAEQQKSETSSHLGDFIGQLSEKTLTVQNPESVQNILDATPDPETGEVPADMEVDVSNLVNHLADEGSHSVRTSDSVSSDTTEFLTSDSEDLVIDSQPAEVTSSVVEEFLIEELASNSIPSISGEEARMLRVPFMTEEISTDEYPSASPVQGTDDDISLGSSDNVSDLVDDHEKEHVNVHHAEPQSQSTTEAVSSIEESVQPLSEFTCNTPVSNAVASEEPALEEPEAERSYTMPTIGLLVVALALAVPFLLKIRKSPTVSQTAGTATDINLFPGTTDVLKTMGSPVEWPSARSGYSSHIPDRDELDAITSPLKSMRAPRKYGMESYSMKYGSAEPAVSAPGVFKLPARVVQKPATTWHPALNSGSTISSSYRQTASYVPTFPSESGITTSTRGTSDSVCESALTMGAEEWEHLGSFTTTELVSVNEGGEEHKVRTPVRRSQRIRNRVSPLPVNFNEFDC